jgi:hypothetical protein
MSRRKAGGPYGGRWRPFRSFWLWGEPPPRSISAATGLRSGEKPHQERRRRFSLLVGDGLALGLVSTVSRLGVKAAARSASLSSGHRSRTILTVRSSGVSGGRS